MPLSRDQKFELTGGIFGVAIAYGGVALGLFLGWLRFGILLLVVTVPAGVVLGWLLARLLQFSSRLLDD
jgi:type III secretory pathway component EscS